MVFCRLARRRWLRAWVVCGSLAGAAADASAQYRIDQFTTSNGLAQNTVSAIAQTRDGYLWFGTSRTQLPAESITRRRAP